MGSSPRKTQVHAQFHVELGVIHRLAESCPRTLPCTVSFMESQVSSAPEEPVPLGVPRGPIPTAKAEAKAMGPSSGAHGTLALGPHCAPREADL